MHIYSRIKKTLTLSPEKKRRTFLSGDISLRGVPTKNGQLRTSRNWVALFTRFIRRKGVFEQNIYCSKVKTTGGRKVGRFVLLASVLLLFVVCGGAELILKRFQGIEYFKVTELTISGNSVLSKEELRSISEIIVHQTSLLGMNTTEIKSKLLANAWISRATVRRNWPSGVEIDIDENTPLAILLTKTASGTELLYIDKKGNPFLSLIPGGKIDFPVVTGLSDINNDGIRDGALKEVLVFLKKASRNDPHLPVQSLSEVHVTKEGDLVVYLVEYPFPIFFGNGNTKQKYGRLVEVLKALYKKDNGKDLISEVEYIQMDYLQDKVLVAQSGQG
ncbi:MAG: hypothetical protein ACI8ZB_002546 [Desulforhopalus sp.]|jgi:hypothetical protein